MVRTKMVAACIALVVASSAVAESVRITGRFPADYREASFLRRMGVGRIDGQDGRAMELAIERELAGRSHFSVVALDSRGGPVDGIISGLITTEINESRFSRQREDCVEKKDDKCVKTEKIDEICRKRTISLLADLRITRDRDGRIVYSARKPRSSEVSWCPNDRSPSAVEGEIRGMIDGIAGEIAQEITPYTRTYSLRFYESRDGMDKAIGTRFRDAIRNTQRDLPGACAELASLEQEAPQFAIAYDVGLCAEARGDYEAALAAYNRARDLRPREAADFNAGIDRARKLIVQRDDERAEGPR